MIRTRWIENMTNDERRTLLRKWYPDVADLLFALIDAGPDEIMWTAPEPLESDEVLPGVMTETFVVEDKNV